MVKSDCVTVVCCVCLSISVFTLRSVHCYYDCQGWLWLCFHFVCVCQLGYLRKFSRQILMIFLRSWMCDWQQVMVKVHPLDIAPLRNESPPQKRSGMAHVLEGFHSFTCTPTRSSAVVMSHTCHKLLK